MLSNSSNYRENNENIYIQAKEIKDAKPACGLDPNEKHSISLRANMPSAMDRARRVNAEQEESFKKNEKIESCLDEKLLDQNKNLQMQFFSNNYLSLKKLPQGIHLESIIRSVKVVFEYIANLMIAFKQIIKNHVAMSVILAPSIVYLSLPILSFFFLAFVVSIPMVALIISVIPICVTIYREKSKNSHLQQALSYNIGFLVSVSVFPLFLAFLLIPALAASIGLLILFSPFWAILSPLLFFAFLPFMIIFNICAVVMYKMYYLFFESKTV